MTWKPKRQATPVSAVEALWEKYGTWITGAVAVGLAAWLAVILVGRWQEGKLKKGQADLEQINRDDPGAAMQLKRLQLEYGDTKVGPRIQLKLAQVMYHNGDFPGAEKLLEPLRGNKDLLPVDRAEVNLELAYLAQERGALAEARKRFEVVRDEGLYAWEADQMLKLLDQMEKGKKETTGEGAPEAPKAPSGG